MENQICFDHVTKIYAQTSLPAVDDVSLEVEAGSFVVFLGPSGSGKTTLLKMVNRLYEPTSGEIRINGVDIRKPPVTELRRGIGYVIQQVGLFPHMTVAENIAVVPELVGWKRPKIDERIDELLTLVHLPPAEYRARYPSQLSGGQQQRVGLARALAADPALMLMDEPFGAIDAINRARLQDEMMHLHQRLKKTVLFVTHDVDEALRLASKIAILRAGRLVQYDTPFHILTNPANDFVRDLVGAEDAVRQLGLLSVRSVMEPLPPRAEGVFGAGEPTIPFDENLHQALSLLLRSGSEALVVTGPDGPVGLLGLDQIRKATVDHRGSQGDVSAE